LFLPNKKNSKGSSTNSHLHFFTALVGLRKMLTELAKNWLGDF
jgi:hypothetical protein